jgi:diaminopimelate epimerase
MRFTKMQGLGNDYVYVDCFEESVDDAPALARRVSDRRFGIGSDGLILICPSDVADVRMEMYNADGSRGEMCGNGLRCVARFHHERHGCAEPVIHAETDAGIKVCELVFTDGEVSGVRIDMGPPILERADIPMLGPEGPVIAERLSVQDHGLVVTCLSMGNPHCVTFVEDAAAFPVERWGKAIEHLPVFPNRVNVEFVEVVSRTELIQRTWERGSGETFACGTGACAVAVAAQLNDLADGDVTIHLTGGDLRIEWSGDESASVFMTGPAETVFDGVLPTA